MSFELDLLLGVFSFVVALLYSQATQAQEPCQQLGQGGDILTRARAERRILQNISFRMARVAFAMCATSGCQAKARMEFVRATTLARSARTQGR